MCIDLKRYKDQVYKISSFYIILFGLQTLSKLTKDIRRKNLKIAISRSNSKILQNGTKYVKILI